MLSALAVLCFILILGLCGEADRKTQKVPDSLIACLYALLSIYLISAPYEELVITWGNVGFSFASLFVAVIVIDGIETEVLKRKRTAYILSWADILIYPPCLALSFNLMGAFGTYLIMVALALSLIVAYVKRTRVAVVPFLFSAILGCAIGWAVCYL